jgi:TRAP-type C4-dicarboxylate transport system permease small subunit
MDTFRTGRAMLERIIGWITCIVIFSMMAITTVDVVMRYAFATPLRGAFEIVTMLLAASVFLALPLVTAANEHIHVDLVRPLLGPRSVRVQTFAIHVVSAGLLGVIAVQMWRHAQLLAASGQVTGFLEWPLAPIAYGMSVMCGLTVLTHAIILVDDLRTGARDGHGPQADSHGS